MSAGPIAQIVPIDVCPATSTDPPAPGSVRSETMPTTPAAAAAADEPAARHQADAEEERRRRRRARRRAPTAAHLADGSSCRCPTVPTAPKSAPDQRRRRRACRSATPSEAALGRGIASLRRCETV